jgi:hypothetical protein
VIKRIVDASPLLRGEAKVSTDRITFASTGATVRALNPLHLPRRPVELSILKKPAGAQRACARRNRAACGRQEGRAAC